MSRLAEGFSIIGLAIASVSEILRFISENCPTIKVAKSSKMSPEVVFQYGRNFLNRRSIERIDNFHPQIF
jgi:hypothetical protein